MWDGGSWQWQLVIIRWCGFQPFYVNVEYDMKQSDLGGVIGIGGAEFISCVAIGFEKCFV